MQFFSSFTKIFTSNTRRGNLICKDQVTIKRKWEERLASLIIFNDDRTVFYIAHRDSTSETVIGCGCIYDCIEAQEESCYALPPDNVISLLFHPPLPPVWIMGILRRWRGRREERGGAGVTQRLFITWMCMRWRRDVKQDAVLFVAISALFLLHLRRCNFRPWDFLRDSTIIWSIQSILNSLF